MNRILWRGFAALCLVAGFFAGMAFAADVPPLNPADRILGTPTAPITVIEYASMSCPHCADFERVTFPKIKSDWIDTGKVRFVYRDFPLDQVALTASVVARSMPPAMYYPFVETLFDNQTAWILGGDPIESLKRFAKLAGMSEDQFNAAVKNDALKQQVIASRQAGEAAGVNSTPTFFINGVMVTGFTPYDQFNEKLKQAASKS